MNTRRKLENVNDSKMPCIFVVNKIEYEMWDMYRMRFKNDTLRITFDYIRIEYISYCSQMLIYRSMNH